jgi:hypothetical protein
MDATHEAIHGHRSSAAARDDERGTAHQHPIGGACAAQRTGPLWLITPGDLEKFKQERLAKWGRVRKHAGSPGRPPKKRKRAEGSAA